MERRVELWCWLYRVDGWFKAVGVLGLVLLFFSPFTSLAAAVPVIGKTIVGPLVAGSMGFGILLVYLSLFLLFLLWIPRSIVRYVLERALNAPLVQNKQDNVHREMLDKLEPPRLDRAIIYVFTTMTRFFNIVSATALATLPLFFTLPSHPLVALSAGFSLLALLIRFMVLPTITNDYHHRVATLVSVQNRLVASLKRHKST